MIDFEAVRNAYHHPPPPGDHVPTIEERVAAFERQRVADALARGIDPKAAALGEHGSLIGGPGKPPTHFEGGRRAEDMVRMPPMPLPWFDHPNAHLRTPSPAPHAYLDTLSADHLAGYQPRPDGRTLRGLLQAETLTEQEAHLVEQFIARLRMIELASLLSRGGLTIYEVARAMLLSGSATPGKTHWMNPVRDQAGGRGKGLTPVRRGTGRGLAVGKPANWVLVGPVSRTWVALRAVPPVRRVPLTPKEAVAIHPSAGR